MVACSTGRRSEPFGERVVHPDRAVARRRTDCEFGVAGRAEFLRRDDLQRDPEVVGDDATDGEASSRNGEDDVRGHATLVEHRGEPTAGVIPVGEHVLVYAPYREYPCS